MVKRAVLITGVVFVSVLLLSACGSAGTSNSITANHVAGTVVPDGTYVDEVRWHGNWYIPGLKVTTVGSQIGIVEQLVKSYPSGSRTVSNYAPPGTKLYSIPGINTSRAIAVVYPEGDYVQAVVSTTARATGFAKAELSHS